MLIVWQRQRRKQSGCEEEEEECGGDDDDDDEKMEGTTCPGCLGVRVGEICALKEYTSLKFKLMILSYAWFVVMDSCRVY